MSNREEQKQPTWTCIYEDFDYEWFPNPRVVKDDRILVWVKCIYYGRTYTTSFNSTFQLADLEFYDKDINKVNLKYAEMECLNARDTSGTVPWGIYTAFTLVDTHGRSLKTGFKAGRGNGPITNVVKLLKAMKEFKNITTYKLYLENEHLKKLNEQWKSIVESLQEQLKEERQKNISQNQS